jgi:hypothetical protein
MAAAAAPAVDENLVKTSLYDLHKGKVAAIRVTVDTALFSRGWRFLLFVDTGM